MTTINRQSPEGFTHIWPDPQVDAHSSNGTRTDAPSGTHASQSFQPLHIPTDAPAWSRTTLRQRTLWLKRVRHNLVSHAEPLTSLIAQESHKSDWEAFTGDLLPLLAACRWHERCAARILSPRRLRGRPFWLPGQRWHLAHMPIGTVGIIATWNYPVQLLGVQLLQALFAGNRVVVKPSERTPRTQALLCKLFDDGLLPQGTLRIWPAGRDFGPQMLRSEPFDHIVFTGSTSVGREVATWAAERLIPTTLELSGHDSAIVLADADAGLAARSIWNAVTMNSGQTCMAPRRVLVEESIYPQFIAALAPLTAGSPARELIDMTAASHAFSLVQQSLARGARSLSGTLEPPSGSTFHPICLVDCPADSPLVIGDHFSPCLAVLPVRNAEHALSIHRSFGQHLSTSIFTRIPAHAHKLAHQLGVSLITINDCVIPTGHPAVGIAPFGSSGWGVTRGELGLLAMSRPVQIARTSPWLRTPTDPPTSALASRIRRFALRWYARGTLENRPQPK